MRTIISFAGIVAICALATAAEAQTTRAARPYRGLFGASPTGAGGDQALDLLLFAGGAQDYDAGVNLPLPSGGRVGDRHLETTASVRYRRGTDGSPWLQVTAAAAARHQPDLPGVVPVAYDANVTIAFPVWPGARIAVQGSGAHTPYFQFVPTPDLAVPDGERLQLPRLQMADFILAEYPADFATGSLEFTQAVGRRATIEGTYRRGTVRSRDRAYGLETENAAARLRYRLSRDVGVRAGYAAGLGEYATQFFGLLAVDDPSASERRTQEFDIGFDFVRPLRVSRRTIAVFNTGVTQATSRGRHYSGLTGEASLRRELGRTWLLGIGFSRSLQYLALLPEPFFGSGTTLSAQGQFSRRLTAAFSAGYSEGEIGIATGSTARTYTVGSDWTLSLTRHLAASAQYVYYRNEFADAPLPALYPPRLERHTARVGLKLWLPVLN